MRYLLTLVFVINCASCATSVKPVAAVATVQPGPVIARIAGRHDTVVIRAGETGPTYSLETAGGEVLVPDMTLGKLTAVNPALAKRIDTLQDSVMLAGCPE